MVGLETTLIMNTAILLASIAFSAAVSFWSYMALVDYKKWVAFLAAIVAFPVASIGAGGFFFGIQDGTMGGVAMSVIFGGPALIFARMIYKRAALKRSERPLLHSGAPLGARPVSAVAHDAPIPSIHYPVVGIKDMDGASGGRSIIFNYTGGSEPGERRLVDVFQFDPSLGTFDGYCHERDDERTFKVERCSEAFDVDENREIYNLREWMCDTFGFSSAQEIPSSVADRSPVEFVVEYKNMSGDVRIRNLHVIEFEEKTGKFVAWSSDAGKNLTFNMRGVVSAVDPVTEEKMDSAAFRDRLSIYF